MFDISWSEFLIVGAVALVFLGPEELPGLLRTIGRYTGMIKRQAAEFRSQFDQAMRDAELDKMKREVERISEDAAARVRDAERGIARQPEKYTENSIAGPHAGNTLAPAVPSPLPDDPDAHDADGIPVAARPLPAEPAGAIEPKTGS